MSTLALILADFGDRFAHHGHRPLRLLLFVLFVLLVVAVVWLVVREVRHRRVQPAAATPGMPVALPTSDAALEQLRLRYARGEIDRDDYVQRLRDLGGTPPS